MLSAKPSTRAKSSLRRRLRLPNHMPRCSHLSNGETPTNPRFERSLTFSTRSGLVSLCAVSEPAAKSRRPGEYIAIDVGGIRTQ